ncbi:VOC family protein [Halioglobus maricola]|uniref:VOC family protein n=1 Tax=Halioglobus maricola TaxID=2601894 RepID=A0A5P9NIZ5_9GAMM|nr:VOC family protein [Halioglobus maricola]QFU75539.1 VOC family protein [Halioglobus maricola]
MNNIIKRTTLMVRDMDKSLAWYQNVLGMDVYYDKPFTLSGEGLAAGKAGDLIRLVILKCEHPEIGMIGLMQWVDPVMEAPPVPTEVTFGLPTFVVGSDDSREAVRQAELLGTRVHSQPHEWSTEGADGNMKHFIGCSLFDPDGHFFELNQLERIEPKAG